MQGGRAGAGAETGNVHEGFNPTLLILIVVVTILLLFLRGQCRHVLLRAKRDAPQKKKPVSKKKMMRERMKRGVAMPGE